VPQAGELPDHFHDEPVGWIFAATAIVENRASITHNDRIRPAKGL
jgi:hypothetical protein